MRFGFKVLGGERGFTLAELLMVVGVSTMGFVALFDLQAKSVRGMTNMVRMQQATLLAENFIENLRLEFSQWTPTESLKGAQKFPHLANLGIDDAAIPGGKTPGDNVEGGPGWVIGDDRMGSDRRVPRAGDLHPSGYNAGIRMATISPGMEEDDQPFCLLYRLTWLQPNRAIRLEVEVSWPMDRADMKRFQQCDFSASTRLSEVRSVTMTSALLINVFNR